MKNPDIWKYIALGALGVYIYQMAKKNGGTLAGNPYGIKTLNGDKIVDTIMPWLNIHPVAKHVIGLGAKQFIQGING